MADDTKKRLVVGLTVLLAILSLSLASYELGRSHGYEDGLAAIRVKPCEASHPDPVLMDLESMRMVRR